MKTIIAIVIFALLIGYWVKPVYQNGTWKAEERALKSCWGEQNVEKLIPILSTGKNTLFRSEKTSLEYVFDKTKSTEALMINQGGGSYLIYWKNGGSLSTNFVWPTEASKARKRERDPQYRVAEEAKEAEAGRCMAIRSLISAFGKRIKTGAFLDRGFGREEITRNEINLKCGSAYEQAIGCNVDAPAPTISGNKDDIICESIQKFGKNGRLELNMGPWIRPKSNSRYKVGPKDRNSIVIFELVNNK